MSMKNMLRGWLGRKRSLLIAAALVLSMAVPAALASPICEGEYQEALAALAGAHLDRGSHQKIDSHVQNAWHMSSRGNKEASVHQLDVALRQLASPATKRISADVREQLLGTVGALRNCLDLEDEGLVTLAITTVYASDDGSTRPTGAGVYLRVNGQTVAQTDVNSRTNLTLPAGRIELVGVVPSTAIGSQLLDLQPGDWREVTLVLDDTKEVVEGNELVLQQRTEGILADTFDAFVLAFATNDGVQPLSGIDFIHIEHPQGGIPVRVDGLFSISSTGEMVAHDLGTLRALLRQQPNGKITILAQGYDDDGFTYANTVDFYLGRFSIEGQLVAPPSYAEIDVGGVEVAVNVLGTPVTFIRVTDAAGRFRIDNVPIGNVGFDSATFQDNRHFYGQGVIFLPGSRSVTLTMRNVVDIQNGVPPLTHSRSVSGS